MEGIPSGRGLPRLRPRAQVRVRAGARTRSSAGGRPTHTTRHAGLNTFGMKQFRVGHVIKVDDKAAPPREGIAPVDAAAPQMRAGPPPAPTRSCVPRIERAWSCSVQ